MLHCVLQYNSEQSNCIALYLYISIVLLAVHSNQKRLQCERVESSTIEINI